MGRRRLEIPNLDNIIQRYVDGESALSLANEFGLVDTTLRKRIKERGIPIRKGTSYPSHTDAAHAAARGRVHSIEERERMALSRQRNMTGVSHLEIEFSGLLDARGIHYTPQLAIGPYNVDFAIERDSVAVEIMGGGYNRHIRSNLPKRREYLLDRGWHLVEIRCSRYGSGFAGAYDYLVSFLDVVRRDPASPRQYRVIRRDGKLSSSKSPYRNHAA